MNHFRNRERDLYKDEGASQTYDTPSFCYLHPSICVFGQFTRYSISVARVKAV